LIRALGAYTVTHSVRLLHQDVTLPAKQKKPARQSAVQRVSFTEIGVKSISRHIVDQILEKLFTGKLRPGDFLGTEQELATTFGSSRLPVREALGRLDALGVVTVTTGVAGGARVASADPERIAGLLAIHFVLAGISHEELLDARAAIEPHVFRLAAQRSTAQDHVALRAHLEKIEVALAKLGRSKNADFREAGEALEQLHDALGNASHNTVLMGLMRVIGRNLFYRYLELRKPFIGASGLEYFRRVVKLIEAGDAEGVAEHARKHILDHRRVFKS
jgi:GntR family transcriptional regulator, transcriptional repressor for pyruvate dehydrogenase complex